MEASFRVEILEWIQFLEIYSSHVSIIEQDNTETTYHFATLINPLRMPNLKRLHIDFRTITREQVPLIVMGIDLYPENLYVTGYIDFLLGPDAPFNNSRLLGHVSELNIEVGPISPFNSPGFDEKFGKLKKLIIHDQTCPKSWTSEITKDRLASMSNTLQTLRYVDISNCRAPINSYIWVPNTLTTLLCRHDFVTYDLRDPYLTRSKFANLKNLTIHCYHGTFGQYRLDFPNLKQLSIRQYDRNDLIPSMWLSEFLDSLQELQIFEVDFLSVATVRKCQQALSKLRKLYIIEPLLTSLGKDLSRPAEESRIHKLPINRMLRIYGNLETVVCFSSPHELISYPVLRYVATRSKFLRKIYVYCCWPRIDKFYYSRLYAEENGLMDHDDIGAREYRIVQSRHPEDFVESIIAGNDEFPELLFCSFAGEASSIRNKKAQKYEGILTIDISKLRELVSNNNVY